MGDEKINCSVCQKQIRKSNISRHMKQKHPTKKCEKCNVEYFENEKHKCKKSVIELKVIKPKVKFNESYELKI